MCVLQVTWRANGIVLYMYEGKVLMDFRFLMYKTGTARMARQGMERKICQAPKARRLARGSGVSASSPSGVRGSAPEANTYFQYNCNFLRS